MPNIVRANFPAIDFPSTEDTSLAFSSVASLSLRDHISCHAGLVNCAGLPLGREDECTDPAGYQCETHRANYGSSQTLPTG